MTVLSSSTSRTNNITPKGAKRVSSWRLMFCSALALLVYYCQSDWNHPYRMARHNGGSNFLLLSTIVETASNANDDAINQVTTTLDSSTISCDAFLRNQARRTLGYSLRDPNQGQHYVTQMQTFQPFHMHFHSQRFDEVRFGSYQQRHYYERHQEQHWQMVLAEYPAGSRVLDVGGNIGFYSLLSASMGPYVIDAFEPQPVHILRFCQSVALNGWRNEDETQTLAQHDDGPAPAINIHQLAVADQTGELPFYEQANPGASGLLPRQGAVENASSPLPSYTVQVTTLDEFASHRGWFQSRPTIAVLKIDVERYESHVIRGAARLLRSGLVRNIFAETSLEVPSLRAQNLAALQLLVNAGYRIKLVGMWSGPSIPFDIPSNTTVAEAVVAAIEDKTSPYLNILWTLD